MIAGVRLAAVALLTVAAVSGSSASSEASRSGQSGVRTTRMTEQSLRKLAVKQKMPEYPAESLKTKAAGVAVAQVVVGVDGRIEEVRLLQAPDDHTAVAVKAALAQWEFRPLTAGPGSSEKRRASGKLYFYFDVQGGSGRVLLPEEALAASTRGASPSKTDGRESAPTAPPGTPGMAAAGSTIEEVDETALSKRMAGGRRLVVIDVRDRAAFSAGHRQGSVNIPLDELPTRAPKEVPQNADVIVDCTNDSPSRCRMAGHMLTEARTGHISILVR